jgi:uncharacterized protein YecT (DUF1311 family)
MRPSQLLLVLAAMALGTWPAGAESPDPKDVTTINACLTARHNRAGQEIDEANCLFKVANPCIGRDVGSVSDRNQIGCLGRERLVWDKIINDSYKTMMDGLDPEQATKLRDMQRAWIDVRDLTCSFWYDYFQGTMANLMIAQCQNRETARRAIYLRVFAVDMAERK